MYSVNRNPDGSIDTGITPEQIQALWREQHGRQRAAYSGNGATHTQFLSTEELTETSELDTGHVLPFEVAADSHHQSHISGTLDDTLLGDHNPSQKVQSRQDVSNNDDIPLDLGSPSLRAEEQVDDFYIEDPGSILGPSPSAAYDPAHQLVDHHAPFEPEFESAVEHLDLEGDFLPEITNIKDEITSGDFDVSEEATFTTPPIRVNRSERILDDDTLDRLQEEMTRIEQQQQRRQGALNETFAAVGNPGQSDVPSPHPAFTTLRQTGFPLQGGSYDRQITKSLDPQPNHSFFPTIHSNSNSDFNAFDDSDTSPQSEMSVPPHRKKTRRKARRDRGDSDGSSTSRPLVPRSEETGKRIMAKDRMDQLSKLIRCKMREAWGITEEEPLPRPEKVGLEWHKGSRDPQNVKFHEAIALMVYHELRHDASIAVPANQRTLEAAQSAANVSFNNFCKRYAYQNDERWKAKSARDAKRGRRWARKDLKQKKRLKAISRYDEAIPQQILRMEYMSSEDSSEGEASGLAPGTWQFYADMTGRHNAEEKVVEVKTPHWRSAQLQNIYDRLDEIAVSQKAENKAKGYTQIPLRRFKLGALRPKNPPRNAEPWMFVDGVRPPPIPRRPKLPNDTAKRRAELALLQGHPSEGGSRKKKAGIDHEPSASSTRHSSITEVTLNQPHTQQTPARSVCENGNKTALYAFNHDHDFEAFDDRLFDTIEENEHYTEIQEMERPGWFHQ
ncbi:hypothetical protein QFC22_004098 [Naganishia vaughanmartiniae]|uniref:Uncharacterized protein n=1 Tax=Naganishia vaughanmartiniae TaxID=1424756 RepID=A0ACC2X2B8_9TREE|nr:hypothetical protein QFC22_004098 [Naganishia vaughanmartiniae]